MVQQLGIQSANTINTHFSESKAHQNKIACKLKTTEPKDKKDCKTRAKWKLM